MNKPLKIKITGRDSLFIGWDDNTETVIPLERLRRFCPCASCKIEREKESPDYIPILGKTQVTVDSIKPVGSYAISISWKDGHNTGIYEYAYLKILTSEKSVI